MATERAEIPIIIGGKEFRTGELGHAVMPHAHTHVLADYHKAKPEHVRLAIEAAVKAQHEWSQWAWEDRVAVFLRAAELLATTWRDTLNAATMLGQSKTVFQAEIDSACELIDFWRVNAHYAQEVYADQPMSSAGMWNSLDYRGLRIEAAVRKYGSRPVLLVASDDDPYATRSALDLQKAGGGIRELLTLTAAGHGTNMLGRAPELGPALVAWFHRTLQ